MQKRKDLPRYEAHHLSDALANAWRSQGPFRHYSDLSLKKPNGQNYLDKHRGKLFTRLLGNEQILWFDDLARSNEPEVSVSSGELGKVRAPMFCFNVHDLSLEEKDIINLDRDINTRIESQGVKRRTFIEEVFGDYSVVYQGVEFRGQVYQGALIRVPVRVIPRGRSGKLSDNLFESAFNAYAFPSIKRAAGYPISVGNSWQEFANKEHFHFLDLQ